MHDYAVVGSGMGGSSIAAYLSAKGFDVALFEKESYLGGCSSTFTHAGYRYNTGATTFAGYQERHVVKKMFTTLKFRPKLIQSDPSIVIIQNKKTTPRYQNFERFLESVDENYPHAKNREFWILIYEINQNFYEMQGHYYSDASLWRKMVSLLSFFPLLWNFYPYLFVDASKFIEQFFTTPSEEYKQFLEAQIRIVAQAPSNEVNFFTAALALGYTFHENYYAVGGFGALFDGLTRHVKKIHTKSEILIIKKQKDGFTLYSKNEMYRAKRVILNTPVYESAKLFENQEIKNYYKKYEKLNNHQSAFMLYMTIKSDKAFYHHYQIIEDENFPHAISNALFVSFSDVSDCEIAPCGYYSITASLHTDTRFWEDATCYKEQKEELQRLVLKKICDILNIQNDEVVDVFAATPKSFERFIRRSQLGGNAITMKNFLPKLPSNDTPIEGLYNVGDTVYPAQGWSGVMFGVENLRRLLRV